MEPAMRTVPLFLILAVAAPAVADEKARALIEKAIQAQGGPDKVAKLRTMRLKVEGTMDLIPGQPGTAFAIEDVWHMPDKYRTTSTFAVMGMKVTQTQVLDGTRGWSEVNGHVTDLPKEAAAEMHEQQYA